MLPKLSKNTLFAGVRLRYADDITLFIEVCGRIYFILKFMVAELRKVLILHSLFRASHCTILPQIFIQAPSLMHGHGCQLGRLISKDFSTRLLFFNNTLALIIIPVSCLIIFEECEKCGLLLYVLGARVDPVLIFSQDFFEKTAGYYSGIHLQVGF